MEQFIPAKKLAMVLSRIYESALKGPKRHGPSWKTVDFRYKYKRRQTDIQQRNSLNCEITYAPVIKIILYTSFL